MMMSSPLARDDQASPASVEIDAQIQILLADMEKLERMVTALQTIHDRPASTAVGKLPAAMERLYALMACIPSPPLGWSAWHSNFLQLALDRSDTETVSRLTDLLESLAIEHRYFQTSQRA